MGTMHRKEVCAALLIEMKNQRGTVHRLWPSSQLALKVFPLVFPLLSPVVSPSSLCNSCCSSCPAFISVARLTHN